MASDGPVRKLGPVNDQGRKSAKNRGGGEAGDLGLVKAEGGNVKAPPGCYKGVITGVDRDILSLLTILSTGRSCTKRGPP